MYLKRIIRKLADLRFNTMLFAATLVSCVALAATQPVSCENDSNCFDGHFCDTSVYLCQECLSCQDLKREPPPLPHPCIKSIRECGPCLKDLVEDRTGELTCVAATDRAPLGDGMGGSSAGWIIAGVFIAVLIALLAAFFIRYMLNHSDIFKFKVDTNIDATLPPVQYVSPTAPESPPPYSPPRPADDLPPFRPGEETSAPLIKPYQPPLASFESQDRQNVSMFNAPAYVRLPNGLRPSEGYNDVNENYAPLIHDEDTSPSPWVPGTSNTDVNSNPSVNAASTNSQPQDTACPGDFSTALAIARNTDLIQPPPAPVQTQFVNSTEEGAGGGDSHQGAQGSTSPPSGSASGNYKVMNVNQIITIIKTQH